MNEEIEIRKELLCPPGDSLKEVLEDRRISQAELALRLGRPKEKVNGLIKGKEPITRKTALSLESVLEIPASYWLNRESLYREEIERIRIMEETVKNYGWLKKFPVSLLKERGFLPKKRISHKNSPEFLQDLLKFFGVAGREQWESLYMSDKPLASYRLSLKGKKNPYACATWLRLGEKKVRGMEVAEYNPKLFKKKLSEIRKIAAEQPEDFLDRLTRVCAEAGVAFAYVPAFPGALYGAARFFGGRPLIQLSGKYKTNDQFWFSFFHEAAHILLHGKTEFFIEDQNSEKSEKEIEADEFAREFLYPKKSYTKITTNGAISDEEILRSARENEIHPGIVVGQLRRFGDLSYNRGSGFIVKLFD